MEYDIILHVIHVSGRRMILQGTDGISRGDYTEGVMVSRPMLEFIPLNESVIERSPTLAQWLENTLAPEGFEILDPEG
jgi:hypothetical protein